MNIIFTLLLSSFSLFAQDFKFDPAKGKAIPTYIAQLTILKGKALKVSKGVQSEIKAGDRFNKGDSIITKDKSFAKLLVVDDTILSVGSNSELNFEDIDFMEKTDRKIIYNFVKGQLTGHVKNKAKENDITVKTSMAAMGVRGTQILVNHQTLNNVSISEFALLTGSAEVQSLKNEKFPLAKSDRVILVQDTTTGNTGSEQGIISRERFSELNREDIDEEREFRPFMKFFEPSDLKNDSSLQPFFVKQPEVVTKNEVVEEKTSLPLKKEEEKPGLRQNLKKLNDKLREYQKDR